MCVCGEVEGWRESGWKYSNIGGIERWRNWLEMKRRRKNKHSSTYTHLRQTVGQENLLPVITLSVGWLCLCLLAPSAHNTTDQVTTTPTQHTHHFSQQSNDLTHWYCMCVCKCLCVNSCCFSVTQSRSFQSLFSLWNLAQIFVCILYYNEAPKQEVAVFLIVLYLLFS